MPFLGCALFDIFLAIVVIVLVSSGVFGDVVNTDDTSKSDNDNNNSQSFDNSSYR